MPMSPETIKTLNYIIDAHNDGSSDEIRADKLKCHVAVIRSFLSLAKKCGTEIKRSPRVGGDRYSPAAKAILSAALREAHSKISNLNGHGS